MKKNKDYGNTHFDKDVIREAFEHFLTFTSEKINQVKPIALKIKSKDEVWNYSSTDEFFKEYSNAEYFELYHGKGEKIFEIHGTKNNTSIGIKLENQSDIQTIFDIFEKKLNESSVITKLLKSPIGKEKTYEKTHFSPAIIQEAYENFLTKIGQEGLTKPAQVFSISNINETWNYGTIAEFISAYNTAESFSIEHEPKENHSFKINGDSQKISIKIKLPDREGIESVFQIFENKLDVSKITLPPSSITIFIGHGGANQWRDLKDHLQDQHGYKIEAYEIGARSGLSIKEILEKMLKKSSMATLVLTGEDIDDKGESHARENVIHELGLFQGGLGFKKTMILLEDQVKEFSNIHGLHQIRFSKGNIKETFGEVLATIKREFGD